MSGSVRLVDGKVPLTKSEKASGVDFATISLNAIFENIRIGDISKIESHLLTIPIERLNVQNQLILLDAILANACEAEEGDVVDLIFKHFDERLSGITRLSTFCLYLMRSGLHDEILEFIARNTTSRSFVNTIYDLNSGETSPEVYEACLNAEKIFGEMDSETLLGLKMYLCMDTLAKNYFLDQYVSVKLGDIEIVKPPSWIVNNADEVVNHTDIDIPEYPSLVLRSPDKYAKGYIKQMKKEYDEPEILDQIKDDFTYNIVATQYAMVPLEEKVAMLNNLNRFNKVKEIKLRKSSSDTDTILFMIYGPNNTSHDQVIKRIDSESPCMRYGGCRMFLCLCGETVEDYFEEDITNRDDWFKGRCDTCSRVIPKKHYSLRRPLALGGWQGCFCSFQCLDDSVKDPQDITTPILITLAKKFIKKVKIQERNYIDEAQTMP